MQRRCVGRLPPRRGWAPETRLALSPRDVWQTRVSRGVCTIDTLGGELTPPNQTVLAKGTTFQEAFQWTIGRFTPYGGFSNFGIPSSPLELFFVRVDCPPIWTLFLHFWLR